MKRNRNVLIRKMVQRNFYMNFYSGALNTLKKILFGSTRLQLPSHLNWFQVYMLPPSTPLRNFLFQCNNVCEIH